jgi:hypothetical protein
MLSIHSYERKYRRWRGLRNSVIRSPQAVAPSDQSPDTDLNRNIKHALERAKSLPIRDTPFWQCKCGWRVSEIEYLCINFDAQCPRCDALYSTFTAVK